MIKAYGVQDRKAYYLFEKNEVKSVSEAIKIVATLAKESRNKFVASFAEKDNDGNYSVELASGRYLCVNKK